MNKKYAKISLIINILITVMVIFACIVMFTGFKFMHGYDIVLESTKLGMFKFFTVDSNILMGIIALIFAYQDILIIKGKIKEIDKKYYLLKSVGTSAVSLTFFVVFAYLGWIAEHGIPSLLMNSNLFFHLLVPITSIICYIFFERNNKLKLKDIIWGIVPTVLYGIWYLINVLIHMENGKVSPKYDFYWFVQNGVKTAIIVVPIILIISYIISLILWRFNKKNRYK